jgi:hypothetical protein
LLNGAVHLPVTTNKEIARSHCKRDVLVKRQEHIRERKKVSKPLFL